MDQFDSMRLVYLLGVLLLIAPALAMVFRERSTLLRNLAIWMGVAVSAALIYLLLNPG